MRQSRLIAMTLALVLSLGSHGLRAEEKPYGKGLTDANKERLIIDDMTDVSGWHNGSPEETSLSRSDQCPAGGKFSLKFANLVDHTKGEKNYPIGWPRTGKDLSKAKRTDWSGYDFFECWIYAQTSRPALPGTPLGVGFYHTGPRRSSSFPLKQVTKDAWSKIVIPIDELASPADVQRVQFNISEADYKHADRVDFYIADVVLTRFVEPAVVELSLRRKLLYSTDSVVAASCKVAGHKGLGETMAEFEIGRDQQPIARTSIKAARSAEFSLPLDRPLEPGVYWARLNLRDGAGKLIDRKQTQFRVIRGPLSP